MDRVDGLTLYETWRILFFRETRPEVGELHGTLAGRKPRSLIDIKAD